MSVQTIARDDLKAKLDRGDDFRLIMALGEWAFNAKRIPGSINIPSPAESRRLLQPDDEIVVYCSAEDCIASISAYHMLRQAGFTNVRRYAGGLQDWEAAGYPLEGDMVDSAP